MPNYSILEVRKIKTSTAMSAAFRHNYRLKDVPNADKAKQALNRDLVPMRYASFTDAYRKKVDALPYYKAHKVRKNAVRAIEVVLTFSHGADMDFSVDDWAKESMKWLDATFNVAPDESGPNIVSAVLHMDEGTPHIHAMIIPIDECGHLNARGILNGPRVLRRMKDEYGQKMERFGLQSPNRAKESYHIPYDKLKDLYTDTKGAMDAIPKPRAGETPEEYYERSLDAMESYAVALAGKSNRDRWNLNRGAELAAARIVDEAHEQALAILREADEKARQAEEAEERAKENARLSHQQAEDARKRKEAAESALTGLADLAAEGLSPEQVCELARQRIEEMDAIDHLKQTEPAQADTLLNALKTVQDLYRQEKEQNLSR